MEKPSKGELMTMRSEYSSSSLDAKSGRSSLLKHVWARGKRHSCRLTLWMLNSRKLPSLLCSAYTAHTHRQHRQTHNGQALRRKKPPRIGRVSLPR